MSRRIGGSAVPLARGGDRPIRLRAVAFLVGWDPGWFRCRGLSGGTPAPSPDDAHSRRTRRPSAIRRHHLGLGQRRPVQDVRVQLPLLMRYERSRETAGQAAPRHPGLGSNKADRPRSMGPRTMSVLSGYRGQTGQMAERSGAIWLAWRHDGFRARINARQ